MLPARPFRNNVLCCVQPAVRSSFTVEITICTNFTYLNCVWHAPSSPSLSSQLRTRCWPLLVVLAPLACMLVVLASLLSALLLVIVVSTMC